MTDDELMETIRRSYPAATLDGATLHLVDGDGYEEATLVAASPRELLEEGARRSRENERRAVENRQARKRAHMNPATALNFAAMLSMASHYAQPYEASYTVRKSGELAITLTDDSGRFAEFVVSGDLALQPLDVVLTNLRARFQRGSEG